MYSYLQFGRDRAENKKDAQVSFGFGDLQSFIKEYGQFIQEMKEDDENNGIEDAIFMRNNYPSWSDILLDKKEDLLKVVINDYMFETFFELSLQNINMDKGRFITDVRKVNITDKEIVLMVRYIEK